MLRRLPCLILGHADRHVRNAIKPGTEFGRIQFLACRRCGREVRMPGWSHVAPPPAPLPPLPTLEIPDDVPEVMTDSSEITVA